MWQTFINSLWLGLDLLDLFPSLPVENRAVNKSSPFCPSLRYSACICPGVKTEFFSFSLHSSSPRFFGSSSLTFSFWSPCQSYPRMLGLVHPQNMPYPFPSFFSLPCCLLVPFLLFLSLSRFALFEASIPSGSSVSSCAGRCPEGAHLPLSFSKSHFRRATLDITFELNNLIFVFLPICELFQMAVSLL